MKNLIYFTLGNNIQYINLAKLCISSLYKQNYTSDIAFITNAIYIDLIKQHISWPNNKMHFIVIDEKTNLLASSANKLKIYKFININEYTNIIYCDLDILWTDSPNNIFNLIIKDKIYLSQDDKNHTMSHKYWGGSLLNHEEKNIIDTNNTIGLNAGLFGFKSSMINEIYNIDQFFNNNLNLANECLEQPFINAYVYRKQIYDLIPENVVSQNGYHYNDTKFNGTVLHFAGGPGNYSYKSEKMLHYSYHYI